MRRREFIGLFGGAAAAWPLTARAQQLGPLRRVGILLGSDQNDLLSQTRIDALQRKLAELGWLEGQNVQLERRFATDDVAIQASANDLVRLGSEVIVASPAQVALLVRRATTSIPIVFANVPDPVSIGLVSESSASRWEQYRLHKFRI